MRIAVLYFAHETVTFLPNDTMTRAMFVTVLYRQAGSPAVKDADTAWCAQAVANLQSVSVIESGRFSNDEMRSGVTRAQAAERV